MLASAGVEAASFTDFVPLSTTAGPWNFVRVEGYTPAKDEIPTSSRALVSPGYFATMRIPLIEGRDFTRATMQSGTGDHRQPAVREEVLPGRESDGAQGARGGQVVHVVGMARDSKYLQSRGGADHLLLPGFCAVLPDQPGAILSGADGRASGAGDSAAAARGGGDRCECRGVSRGALVRVHAGGDVRTEGGGEPDGGAGLCACCWRRRACTA